MALIKEEDVQRVRERVRIDEIVEQYVTLKIAGGGSRVGLCPFHDEKTPSFNVRPAQGFYHCFGCGEGGDAIKFLRQIEGLSFAEAVERIAAKYGIELRYEEGAAPGHRRDIGLRQRLLEAHTLAAEFYASALASAPEAQVGRTFVTDRGFDQAAAELFGMGWAPRSGQSLVDMLRDKGFTDDELVAGGLAGRGSRGLYDRFRGRLMWPIREMSGEVIGFGARRMFDDDRIEAKYLNTSETPIYKKSGVLYGIDLARRSISSKSQAVIVEGYTDVMACHVAGVTTAVATCGTAFGENHARLLRRILLDNDAFHGEVIFTFDGDEAGQRAALKTFAGDQQFVAQTYVAIEAGGMDPCDLRLAQGDAAVRELVASRIPLYRFVLDNTLSKFDLDRADQRVDAIREAVKLASAVRDRSKIDSFLREIASAIGADLDQVRAEYKRGAASGPTASRPAVTSPQEHLGSARYNDEREALKAAAQYPHRMTAFADGDPEIEFTHPVSAELWQAMCAFGFPEQADPSWLGRLNDAIEGSDLAQVLHVAAVEPLHMRQSDEARMVAVVMDKLRAAHVDRQLLTVKSKLQRTNPVNDPDAHNQLFVELMGLEARRRALRDRVIDLMG